MNVKEWKTEAGTWASLPLTELGGVVVSEFL